MFIVAVDNKPDYAATIKEFSWLHLDQHDKKLDVYNKKNGKLSAKMLHDVTYLSNIIIMQHFYPFPLVIFYNNN